MNMKTKRKEVAIEVVDAYDIGRQETAAQILASRRKSPRVTVLAVSEGVKNKMETTKQIPKASTKKGVLSSVKKLSLNSKIAKQEVAIGNISGLPRQSIHG